MPAGAVADLVAEAAGRLQGPLVSRLRVLGRPAVRWQLGGPRCIYSLGNSGWLEMSNQQKTSPLPARIEDCPGSCSINFRRPYCQGLAGVAFSYTATA